MSRITDKTKLREKRGTGEGASYKPWIQAREVGSIGTESVFNDWKHGRPIQCLSQGEARTYHLLRWKDDVLDIREQFPLDLKLTLSIARHLQLPHPHNSSSHMTTDFLVTYDTPNGKMLKAYSVKPNIKHMTDYALKNFAIEQAYWGVKGVHLEVIFSDNLNSVFAENVKRCVRYYDIKSVQSKMDFIKFMIAQKILVVDMTQPIDFPQLVTQHLQTESQIQQFLLLLKKKKSLLSV